MDQCAGGAVDIMANGRRRVAGYARPVDWPAWPAANEGALICAQATKASE